MTESQVNRGWYESLLPEDQIEPDKLLINEKMLANLRAAYQAFEAQIDTSGYVYLECLPAAEKQLMIEVLNYSQYTRSCLASYHLRYFKHLDAERLRQQTIEKLEPLLSEVYGWTDFLIARAFERLDDHFAQELGRAIEAFFEKDNPELNLVNHNFWRLTSRQPWVNETGILRYQQSEIGQRFIGSSGNYLRKQPLVVRDASQWLEIMQLSVDESNAYHT